MTEASNGGEKSHYQRYIDEITLDISEIVQQLGSQPILFVGSGLAKRYFSAPNWEELLAHLANQCSLIDKGLGFYKQSLGTPMAIGETFAHKYQEWAWTAGQNDFPKEMFSDNVAAGSYIKFKISQHLKSITPSSLEALTTNGHADEISALQAIKPHAIITTNYDQMIETLFPDLEPIVGQQILKSQSVSIGEIFKIHGCVSDPAGLVFTSSDYDAFMKKRNFLVLSFLLFSTSIH